MGTPIPISEVSTTVMSKTMTIFMHARIVNGDLVNGYRTTPTD